MSLNDPLLTLSLQVGDAGDPEPHNAPAVGAARMEERDGDLHHAVLPQHGEVPVLHSRADDGKLTWTSTPPPPSPSLPEEETGVELMQNSWTDSSGTHELLSSTACNPKKVQS